METDAIQWEVTIPVKTFLTMEVCPQRWQAFDLYLFRDQQVIFYVGQSQCAFYRVWEHIRGGPHGHSMMGRFVLCNWPKSAGFSIELMNSQGPRFAPVGHNRDAAEQWLIETLSPCFNVVLNAEPSPLPETYLPANAPLKYFMSFRRMLREAKYVMARPSRGDSNLK